ncbi:tryptophan aminotransferase-related protein 3 isoform X2 [Eucalyptus grandis]|uniref:tryptophan aminotransferase-related protein 3 isoform X2 n=1 Tax=Eucalyptus grandis TaxID=71139 RepID=UPI00192F03E0|nr:tryptophan aminotransferase-related protein 3 isoform X2 [Eucalyptus grandis]
MARSEGSICKLCLVCSVIANLFFGVNLYRGRRGLWGRNWSIDEVSIQGLSWSGRAAAEAESAAARECSGHGRAYLDGVVVDGRPACECNNCYGGPDCSLFLPSCFADADEGDPLFLEPFWKQHAESSAVMVAGWHRMSYSFSDQTTLSQELESLLRKLHSLVGNAITDGKYILFGAGSTQLLSAAVHALSPHNSSLPASVVASIPYYSLYREQTEFFNSADCSFQGDPARWKNATNTTGDIIEFVTAPNNPNGQLNEAVLHGPNIKTIYDRAYYWPHFTGIPSPADEDLTIFTISKLTGHAGSRFGWAFIRNEEVYQRMNMYLELNTMGVSRDTQLRALKLLKVIIKDGGREIFEFGYKTMTKRWDRLRKTLSMSNRFSLQKVPPENCTYFQKVREPTPAYAWVKCEWEEDTNCIEILNAAKILGRGGSIFHDDHRYVRLSVIKSDDDFDVLISHLEGLVSGKDGAKIM